LHHRQLQVPLQPLVPLVLFLLQEPLVPLLVLELVLPEQLQLVPLEQVLC
jgi:hypothetical protein